MFRDSKIDGRFLKGVSSPSQTVRNWKQYAKAQTEIFAKAAMPPARPRIVREATLPIMHAPKVRKYTSCWFGQFA